MRELKSECENNQGGGLDNKYSEGFNGQYDDNELAGTCLLTDDELTELQEKW